MSEKFKNFSFAIILSYNNQILIKYLRNLNFFGKKLNLLRGHLTTMYLSMLITERVVMLANPNKAPKKPYKSHPFQIKFKPINKL
jgi:hypothetical protein